jgi:sucrose phosphorylase
VWTTFSSDQIDLNYRSPDVLLRMIKVLLFYVRQGARMIRMDAVAYLWKEIGTGCIHLPQTHAVVKLFRKILDIVAPETLIITETNVPHQENVSYFGNSGDEAQLVYNFSLPPLLLHALARGDASVLSRWAGQLSTGHRDNTFFNFTASHDGIGVRPLEGILPRSEIDFLVDRVQRNGGMVSYKADSPETKSPYELNVTYLDALKRPGLSEDPFHAIRFLASQAIALALPGIPGIYIHSILGSRNWYEGAAQTGRARAINRQKLSAEALEEQLRQRTGMRAEIFFPLLEIIRIRKRQPAFHPAAGFSVVDLHPGVFAVWREARSQRILALTNLREKAVTLPLPRMEAAGDFIELISKRRISAAARVTLAPYQVAWLSEEK